METSQLPADLITVHVRPLADRLERDEVLSSAIAVDEKPGVLQDPRLATALFDAISSPTSIRLLLNWPDGSLGFAFIPYGQPLADVLIDAYATARSALEAVHLKHAPAAAPEWSN